MNADSKFNKRSGIVLSFLLAWAAIAAVHVFFYACVQREKLLEEAGYLSIRRGILPAPRGEIRSSDGVILAENRVEYDLVYDSEKSVPAVLLSALNIGTPRKEKGRFLLKKNVPVTEMEKIGAWMKRDSRLNFVPRVKRIAHAGVGTVIWENDRLRGTDGLELKYDRILSGKPGVFSVMLDRRGGWVPGTLKILEAPVPGKNVVLGKEDL